MNGEGTMRTDAMWRRPGLMPSGKATAPGFTAKDERLSDGSDPARQGAGSPSRDLPERSDEWNGVSCVTAAGEVEARPITTSPGEPLEERNTRTLKLPTDRLIEHRDIGGCIRRDGLTGP